VGLAVAFRVYVEGRNEAVAKLYARTPLITDPTSELATNWEFRDSNYRVLNFCAVIYWGWKQAVDSPSAR
jgi:hypothetical protein